MYNRIKDLREDKDLFQKDIAKILNVTQAQYSRIETNENQLSYDGLIKLALFYNTSTDYILGLTNVKDPYPRSK
ncbi:MAG: helix-turn-helix transcriptional regulator [bacterium]|nr:helix-turn-helix transcriptional regulator [bacterium]